jgi:hypothetical protein
VEMVKIFGNIQSLLRRISEHLADEGLSLKDMRSKHGNKPRKTKPEASGAFRKSI